MTECSSKDAAWCHQKPQWLKNLGLVSLVPWTSVSLSMKWDYRNVVKNKVICTVYGSFTGVEEVSTVSQLTTFF